jgi:hypothetical protein
MRNTPLDGLHDFASGEGLWMAAVPRLVSLEAAAIGQAMVLHSIPGTDEAFRPTSLLESGPHFPSAPYNSKQWAMRDIPDWNWMRLADVILDGICVLLW